MNEDEEQMLTRRLQLALTTTTLLSDVGLLCPLCPVCGAAPGSVSALTWPGQAFCAADDCPALMWDPTASAKANLDASTGIDLDLGEGS